MNIILCDDEEVYLQTLEKCILTWAEVHGCQSVIIIHRFRSSEDLVDAFEQGMHMDALFMDVQIPGEMNGLQAAQQIFSRNEHIPIVFLTNYPEYACDGYKVNALRYLRKPVNQADIDECMDLIRRRCLLLRENAVVFEASSQILSLPAETIISIEAVNRHLNITTVDKTGMYSIRGTLKMMEKQLANSLLVQCHRSYYVNIRYVMVIQNGMIKLSTGKQIPIGRSYSKHFIEFFKSYHGVGRQ